MFKLEISKISNFIHCLIELRKHAFFLLLFCQCNLQGFPPNHQSNNFELALVSPANSLLSGLRRVILSTHRVANRQAGARKWHGRQATGARRVFSRHQFQKKPSNELSVCKRVTHLTEFSLWYIFKNDCLQFYGILFKNDCL